ncbi:MAG: undecaprenyl-diphosphate phosphatase [Patescibacteria group bacterium]
MFDFFNAAILGVVEGFTEFLPISSTGHLILASRLLGIAPDDFVKSFQITIQLGAILAVVALYWKRLFTDFAVMKKIAFAFIPTGIIGFALYKTVKSVFLESETIVLWSLLIGGIILIAFEWWHREREDAAQDLDALTYQQSFFIGLAQSVSIIPGVSRAAATIMGGLLVGVSRRTIVEFSFLLAVPTMVAATGYDLIKNAGTFSSADFGVLVVGFMVSFAVAMVAIRFFISYVQRHTFTAFGIYRIILALIFFLFI